MWTAPTAGGRSRGLDAGMSGVRELGIARVRPARAIKEAVQLIHRRAGRRLEDLARVSCLYTAIAADGR